MSGKSDGAMSPADMNATAQFETSMLNRNEMIINGKAAMVLAANFSPLAEATEARCRVAERDNDGRLACGALGT